MRRKRFTAALLCAAMIAALMFLPAPSAYAVSSGTCGEQVTWTLSDNGELVISGSGAMYEYSFSSHGRSPFYGKQNIKSVKIYFGVTSISDVAFGNCENLVRIDIPTSVGYIGQNAFFSCVNLKDVYYEGQEEDWNAITGEGKNDFPTCTEIHFAAALKSAGKCGEDVTWQLFEDGTLVLGGTGDTWDYKTTVGERSPFYNNSFIKSVIVENGVTRIGKAMFHWCSKLTSLTLPESLRDVPGSAFAGCNLDQISLNGDSAFFCVEDGVLFDKEKTTLFKCPEKKSGKYVVPETVASIAGYAFYRCSLLTDVVLPAQLESIGNYSFNGCNNITAICIPANVRSIGTDAFCSCSSIERILVDEANSAYCSADGMLYNKKKTTLIQCPMMASGRCEVPEGVSSLGGSAFRGCEKLTEIQLPSSIKSIGSEAFCGCKALEQIDVDKSSTYFDSVDGVLYSKDHTKLVRCPPAFRGAFEVCEGIRILSGHSFCGCSKMTKITTHGGLERIENYTFDSCTTLKSVFFSGGLESIGSYSFNGCSSLEGFGVPAGTATIGSNAFRNCKALAEITLPVSVNSIGADAFYGCKALSLIRYAGTKVRWDSVGGSGNIKEMKIQYDAPVAGVYGTVADGVLSGYTVTCATNRASLAAVSYDDNGKVLDLRVIALAPGSSSGIVSGLKKGACCKLMLLDGDNTPLCSAWVRYTD
ncbi:MAG: leucine-rich repeat domain-containing protein [Oscillospiraceae bacterium]|nr:leucine-rich repeat domain-containing protein [Oscillospiraceae bacterium]